MEQKPTLRISKGELATLKLDKVKPFKEGSNTFDGQSKPWFGYNAIKDGVEYTYFASQSVHDLIMASGIRAADPFTLELRSAHNKEGQLRSIWYLNGKNIYQYQDADQAANSESPPSKQITPDPTPVQQPPVVAQPDANPDQKSKIMIDLITQVEINLSNANDILKKLKEEASVPF